MHRSYDDGKPEQWSTALQRPLLNRNEPPKPLISQHAPHTHQGNCSARVACREALGLPGTMMKFDWDSAFWVNSAVATLVYAKEDRAAPLVTNARCALEDYLAPRVTAARELAASAFEAGNDAGGLEALTQLAEEATREATKRWTELWQVFTFTSHARL